MHRRENELHTEVGQLAQSSSQGGGDTSAIGLVGTTDSSTNDQYGVAAKTVRSESAPISFNPSDGQRMMAADRFQ